MEKFCDLLKEKKYELACSYLDNNINNLKLVIESIKTNEINDLVKIMKVDATELDQFKEAFLMCCTYSIISNPFNFYDFLDSKDCDLIIDFCVENLYKLDINRLAVAVIVHLSKQNIIITKYEGKFYIKEKILSPELAYFVLCEYSKLTKVPVDFDRLDKSAEFDFNNEKQASSKILLKPDGFYFLQPDDNQLILNHKINILVNQVKRYKIKDEVLKDFSKLLNHQSSSVGWTLSNAMAKLAKYFETKGFIALLVSRCSEIFANENLWINTLTVLGILSLKGNDVGDVSSIIELGLLYDNEFVYRSSLVREHTLFLVWSLVQQYVLRPKDRPKDGLSNLFNLIVFVYVFDDNFNVKRAAASVLFEFVGAIELENRSFWLSLMQKGYHKRIENGNLLLEELSQFYNLKVFSRKDLFNKLNHHNPLVKELASYFIVKFSDPSDFIKDLDFNLSKDKLSFLYIAYYALKDKVDGYKECISALYTFKIDEKLYKIRNSNNLIFLYLSCLQLVIKLEAGNKLIEKANYISDNKASLEFIQDNLIFILSKNIYPKETSYCCWSLATPEFNKKLLSGLRRNTESFIFANTQQNEFPLVKFKQNLISENLDLKISTYKGLKYLQDPTIFRDEIIKGLDDYSVDLRGDISYKIRLECLYMALWLGIEIEHIFIRFLVDKSKFLREHCVTLALYLNLLKSQSFIKPKKIKYFINFTNEKALYNQELEDFLGVKGLEVKIPNTIRMFFTKFEILMNQKQKEGLPIESSYFESMLEASDDLNFLCQWEFYNGICSTVLNSDKKLSDWLLEILATKKETIKKLMETKANNKLEQVIKML